MNQLGFQLTSAPLQIVTTYSEFLVLQDIDEDSGVLCVNQLEYNITFLLAVNRVRMKSNWTKNAIKTFVTLLDYK